MGENEKFYVGDYVVLLADDHCKHYGYGNCCSFYRCV